MNSTKPLHRRGADIGQEKPEHRIDMRAVDIVLQVIGVIMTPKEAIVHQVLFHSIRSDQSIEPGFDNFRRVSCAQLAQALVARRKVD